MDTWGVSLSVESGTVGGRSGSSTTGVSKVSPATPDGPDAPAVVIVVIPPLVALADELGLTGAAPDPGF